MISYCGHAARESYGKKTVRTSSIGRAAVLGPTTLSTSYVAAGPLSAYSTATSAEVDDGLNLFESSTRLC